MEIKDTAALSDIAKKLVITALEQISLDFIRTHGRTTNDPAEVLSIAWQVYA